jgi:hypothetical protein
MKHAFWSSTEGRCAFNQVWRASVVIELGKHLYEGKPIFKMKGKDILPTYMPNVSQQKSKLNKYGVQRTVIK